MEDHTAVDATLDTFEEYGSHPVPRTVSRAG